MICGLWHWIKYVMVSKYLNNNYVLPLNHPLKLPSINSRKNNCSMKWTLAPHGPTAIVYNNKSTKINSRLSHFPCAPEILPLIDLNNILIFISSEVGYLGLNFDDQLTWALHLKSKKTAHFKINLLHPLICICICIFSYISTTCKLTIYKQ